jgi:hypothetical protein
VEITSKIEEKLGKVTYTQVCACYSARCSVCQMGEIVRSAQQEELQRWPLTMHVLLQPTSEMFEEEIKVTTTQTDKMGGGKGSANFGPNTGKWSQF